MLVVSRMRDETVMIGDDIEVRVVDIRGEKVRLGFDGPLKIAFTRGELLPRIRDLQRFSRHIRTCDPEEARAFLNGCT